MNIVISLLELEAENDYIRALVAAGAERTELIDLPHEPEAIDRALADADGLLLGGGDDVEPRHYGEDVRHDSVETDPDRDRRELRAYAIARARRLPLLAICRGLQVVNVARGGSLIQDIPSAAPSSDVVHRLKPKTALAHSILIDPGAAGDELRRAFSSPTPEVNSRHHQAIARLAPDLHVAALAPDGIVEAVAESQREHDLFLAVQWHPENLHRLDGHGVLFERFVGACRQRAAVARESELEVAR